ncbi:amino acid adenylation domain-containing protein [Bacillus sp. FJAT-29790]|uniref:non-ribosomal peptide synthetase n=1 Tax=Bacillus sp. FJAT-29790 TaxID=1895002 RepID=UPI001C220759|nr:non-ribosomal peptide synthetase [Bacillus sp. FJAT-29790]MBU8881309.1 amino acid adenylation domain-containing protein [Bacillus sp. FJAT-29790]
MKKTLLNFPIKSDLKGSKKIYHSSVKELPYQEYNYLASSFIAWVYRMTSEEKIVINLLKGGVYYPVKVEFKGEVTGSFLLKLVEEALRMEGSNNSSSDLIFSDGSAKAHNEALLELIANKNFYHFSGKEYILNSSYETRYLSSYNLLALDLKNNSKKHVLDLNMLTVEELSLWRSVNNNSKEYPKGNTLNAIFSKTAMQYKEKIAITCDQGEVTFSSIESQSNRVANYLLSKGVHVGDYVSVYMDRSSDMLITMLGVMKAGAVYVPLSPDNPKERNAFILADTQTKCIITSKQYNKLLMGFLDSNTPFMNIEDIHSSSENPNVKVSEEDIAYIIYTSGSTGNPKGVKIRHKSIVAFGYSMLDAFPITSEDVLTQFYTLTFDASFLEVCPMLFTGARLYMLTEAERVDVTSFAEALERENITFITAFPVSVLKQFSLYATEKEVQAYRSLKVHGVGGETLTGEIARLFQQKFPSIPLVNIYGPTECTVASSVHKIEGTFPNHRTSVPIGKPLNNYSYYIVNKHNHLNPIGVEGELLIATDGLSEGYLNLPKNTASTFVQTQLIDRLVYRTGDSAKLLEDGTIEFIGRKDNQIKIRGYRVEIGEIEDKLLQIPFVEVGVTVVKSINDDNMLVAYYTLKDGETGSSKEVLNILSERLPKYMIPSYIIELKEMPLLPNGKIDRKKLASLPLISSSDTNKKLPTNEIEEKLAQAWKEVLNLETVGVDENFFEIGGHSLKVLATLTKLKKDFPTLKINDFFNHPTIESLAQKIVSGSEGEGGNGLLSLGVTELFEHPKRLSSDVEYKAVNQTGILLTGVTGYLGSHILMDLIRDTDATIYTLIRSKSKKEALDRLKSTLAYYASNDFYNSYNLQERVVVLSGDFTESGLGLSDSDKELVLNNINSIIHCGADVRHFGAKAEFVKTNINSTHNLLELATTLSNVRFHYVSTLGIPEDLAVEGYWDAFIETDNISDAPHLSNLYSDSKLESEKLVERYYKKGVPVTIYRPGNISCQYETGLFQRNIDSNAVYRMLKSFILLGVAPDVDYNMDFIMVDYASKAITTVAMSDDSIGGVYNICNPKSVSYKEFIQVLRDYGYGINLLSQEEYINYLYSDIEKNKEGLELAMAGLEGDGAKDSPLTFLCPNTLELLIANGVEIPVSDKAFIGRMLQRAIKEGYLKEPSKVVVHN